MTIARSVRDEEFSVKLDVTRQPPVQVRAHPISSFFLPHSNILSLLFLSLGIVAMDPFCARSSSAVDPALAPAGMFCSVASVCSIIIDCATYFSFYSFASIWFKKAPLGPT